jgi:predicted lipoprotein with Yx(FWY)xxD motif
MSDRRSSSQRTPPSLPLTPADISLFEESGAYVLRDQGGMALYQYDLDVDGQSRCVDACSKSWPPVIASADATPVVGDWKTIKRGNARQWTFRGKPIYTYAKDAPGGIKGDGVDGVWRLVSP